MSFRAFINSIKEGFKGIIRHPLVTIASVSTILLMLIVMSVFFIFSLNARSIMRKISMQPPIEVYMELNSTPEEVANTENYIRQNPNIINVIKRSPVENYNNFKTNLGSSSSILDDFDYNMYLPYTFSIQITDPAMAPEVSGYLQTLPKVHKVSTESNVMNFLSEAKGVVNIATVASFVVLFIIALFIISNMVRISVYSRANEIGIMKFVGATNAYIRIPFIIEGGIVGFISAICAWVISILVYRAIFIKTMVGIDWSSYYALLPYKSIMWFVLVLCLVMGVFIGSIGSGIAVRKHVRV